MQCHLNHGGWCHLPECNWLIFIVHFGPFEAHFLPQILSNEVLASTFFPRCVFLNRLTFGFTSEHLVTLFSTVADGKLRSLPIIALTFQTSRCCFRRSVSLGLPPLRLLKALAFRSFIWFSSYLCLLWIDLSFAAPDSTMVPMISPAKLRSSSSPQIA